MKAIVGATGTVGPGVLRECLLDLEVSEALAVGRSPHRLETFKLARDGSPKPIRPVGSCFKLERL